MCAAGVGVREAAKCKHEPSRNKRLVIWRANVATRFSCVPGADGENLRRADETLASGYDDREDGLRARNRQRRSWCKRAMHLTSRSIRSLYVSCAAAVIVCMLLRWCRALP